MIDLASATGSYTGTCGFRLMPTDALAVGPATATLSPVTQGKAFTLDYTWTHPEQGPQMGLLLFGTPGEDGGLNAALTDTFHQQPNLGILSGTAVTDGFEVAMTYSGWGWTIRLEVSGAELILTMHNVIPEGIESPTGMAPVTPGPYLVMDGRLTRS